MFFLDDDTVLPKAAMSELSFSAFLLLSACKNRPTYDERPEFLPDDQRSTPKLYSNAARRAGASWKMPRLPWFHGGNHNFRGNLHKEDLGASQNLPEITLAMLKTTSVVLLAAASTALALTEFNWTTIEPSTSLNWTACYADGLDCTRLLVPLDYVSPNNSTTAAIAITRFRSTSPSSSYRGPILINPGGPGESGVEFAVVYGSEIASIVGAEYDIVGFDPRGRYCAPASVLHSQVNRQTTISWFLDDAERAMWSPPNQDGVLPSLNETALSIPYAYARAQVQSQLAAARDADFLQYMTTDYTARDMLTITEAFGFKKLQYWGGSYGSVLGQTFAALFPDKVDRVVIDGVLPIDDWYSANLTEAMLDADQVLDAFFTSCFKAGPSLCAFHNNASSPSDIAAAYENLLSSIQQNPIPAVVTLSEGNAGYGVVDYSVVKNVVFSSLYQPYTSFPALAQALADLAAGNSSTIYAASGAQEFTCGPGAAPLGSALEATISITCNDATPNDTLADLQRYYTDAAVITEFADVFATGRVACAGWKVHRPGQYTGPTGPTNTSAPLLVIGNLRDPATAWPGANETANVLFPGAGLLTYNVSGHTSFVAPSTCLYDYVGAYFRNGTLPPAGTVCQPDAGVQLVGTNATDSAGLQGRVTFRVAKHKAETVADRADYSAAKTAREILNAACPTQAKNAGVIRGTSFEEAESKGPGPAAKKFNILSKFTKAAARRTQPASAPETTTNNVIPNSNGFFHSLSEAYNQHHHLILRPDDVWLAILVQFNFFVNANSEALRASFVAHEGQKTLEVERGALADFGEFARAMTEEIEKNVVDPTLRAWALPDFSTTTVLDTTVASIMLMATLKAYFQYVFSSIECGIPSVTLEGEKADWEKLLGRAEKLKEYGIETIAWYHLLVPVLTRFVKAFDEPEAPSNIDFWQKVARYEFQGSGSPEYSGWASAFIVFDDKGRWTGLPLKKQDFVSFDTSAAPESMTADEFWTKFLTYDPRRGTHYRNYLILDDTPYHVVEAGRIPPCFAEVEVLLVNKDTGEETQTSMVAGMIAAEVGSSLELLPSESGMDDVIKPLAGWWLFEKQGQEAPVL
uniref:AB hydrolase-1 domain-containing protein n=1 Tax=Mycena chlorophos TaxID=658473 RepID=A0ABQ0LXL9_MYCCL|nr:predicted protein [Mycena chlorophos]